MSCVKPSGRTCLSVFLPFFSLFSLMLESGMPGFFLSCLLLCFPERTLCANNPSEWYSTADWSQSKSEVLEYEVEKVFMGRELRFPAWIITDLKYYDTGKNELSREKSNGTLPVFQVSMHFSYNRWHFDRHHHVSLVIQRKSDLPLLLQEVVIHDWESRYNRRFHFVAGIPTLKISSTHQGGAVYSFEKSPVLTTEQLFFYVRSLPLDKNHSEKIWLLENLLEDGVNPEPVFAEITVNPKIVFILEKQTKQVTIDCGQKGILDFWPLANGMHQVVLARLSNGTLFKLKKINQKKYWRF